MTDTPTLILQSLQTGPKRGEDLKRETGASKRGLYHHLGALEKQGKVVAYPLRSPNGWLSLFCLPVHETEAAKVAGFTRNKEPVLEEEVKK